VAIERKSNMRITAFAVAALLAATLFSPQLASQDTKNQDAADRDSFATRLELSKGGIGMVNRNLYIVVKSTKNDRNELIMKPTEESEERWKGKSVTKAEVAIFYEGKVWSPQAIPDGFDLSKAVVVSFERRKIRFFDFPVMAGGYYNRIGE
jgi:hypothetical protein